MINTKLKPSVQRQELQNILKLNCSNTIKIALIQSKIAKLSPILDTQRSRNKQQNKEQNMSTSITDNQSNFPNYQLSIEELEEKIIQKRIIKFQIHQQIENLEEQLLRLEEIAEVAMNYDHSLRKKIDYYVKNNSKPQQTNQLQEQDQTYINKSLQNFTSIFKNWFK